MSPGDQRDGGAMYGYIRSLSTVSAGDLQAGGAMYGISQTYVCDIDRRFKASKLLLDARDGVVFIDGL